MFFDTPGLRGCVAAVRRVLRPRVRDRPSDDRSEAAQVRSDFHPGEFFLHGQLRHAKGEEPAEIVVFKAMSPR